MRINQLIEHLCKNKKISQAALARRVGMQATHLNHFIRGRGDIRASRLVNILEELGIDLSAVLFENSEISKTPETKATWPNLEKKALQKLIENIETQMGKPTTESPHARH